MTHHAWLALVVFAAVASITPGPNNLMLLASGANFGLKRTLPHMLGVSLGFTVMLLSVGLGLGQVFTRLPWMLGVLKWLGTGYMLYLAWRIARSGPPAEARDGQPDARPMRFLAAAAFQWVNPKAWMMGVGAFSTYVPATNPVHVIVLAALVFGLINMPCVSVWAVFGSSMRHVLQRPRTLRAFNWTMAALLVASLYPMLTG